MRLIEVEECSMLSQHYEAPRISVAGYRTKEQSKRMLLSSFGGKTAMRAIERKERMKINVDVVKEQLNQTINRENRLNRLYDPCSHIFILFYTVTTNKDDVEKDDFDQIQEERAKHLEKMIPPMNIAAKKVNEVYKLTDLIDFELLVRLESEAIKLLQTDPEEIP